MEKPVLSPDFIHKKQQRIFCVQARTEEYAAGAACGLRGEQGRMLLPYSIMAEEYELSDRNFDLTGISTWTSASSARSITFSLRIIS